MILSGKEIVRHMGKEIVIEPFDPNSYNLSLASELLVYEAPELDMKRPNPVKKLLTPKGGPAAIWAALGSFQRRSPVKLPPICSLGPVIPETRSGSVSAGGCSGSFPGPG